MSPADGQTLIPEDSKCSLYLIVQKEAYRNRKNVLQQQQDGGHVAVIGL